MYLSRANPTLIVLVYLMTKRFLCNGLMSISESCNSHKTNKKSLHFLSTFYDALSNVGHHDQSCHCLITVFGALSREYAKPLFPTSQEKKSIVAANFLIWGI